MNSATPYVYRHIEAGLFTVGFYDPDGKWMPESDWGTSDQAATRVHFMNGGTVENFSDFFRACRNAIQRHHVEGGAA